MTNQTIRDDIRAVALADKKSAGRLSLPLSETRRVNCWQKLAANGRSPFVNQMGGFSAFLNGAWRKIERVTVANQPRRSVLPKHLREDPRAGTAAGRLFLLGEINADQFVAAERFVSLVRQFLHVLSAPMAPASFLGKIVALCAQLIL